jgi:hypothetical protein
MTIMNTNDNKINNYSAVLDKKYGLDGTPERDAFEQNAFDFYSEWFYIKRAKRLK